MMRLTEDEKFMRAAIREAKKASAIGEVPIGCVIVREGRIIARGYNRRITEKNTLAHAELSAIRKACKKTGDWRLEDCVLYVTLEPCPMCAGAIINARIDRLVFGAYDEKAGAVRSVQEMFSLPYNHRPRVTEGLLEYPCAELLSSFFQSLRDAET